MFDRYSIIDMFGPFHGDNWYPPEIAGGITFRWTGPAEQSFIRVPSLGARDLRLRWTFPILPQEHQLGELHWSADGSKLAPHWAMRSGYTTLWADLHINEPKIALKVTIGVPHRLKMSDDNPDDTRVLGLAVHKLEIFALDADTLGVEAQRLRSELDMREREISDLQESTSWKLTRPLRWLKESFSSKP